VFPSKPGHADRSARERTVAVSLLLGFALSRLLLFRAGIALDATGFARLWQAIDPELLRHDLLRSLAHLHGQPPLFNLYAGLGIKLFGAAAGGFYQVAQILAGVLAAAAVFLALRALGVPLALRAVASGLYALSPAAIVYENWLFYPIFEAALLASGAWLIERYVRSGSGFAGALGFAALGSMVLLRSYFHLAWLLAIVAFVAVFAPQPRRRTLGLAAVPVLLCALWYGKNLWLFGGFTSSTWLGMSASRITIETLPPGQRKRLVQEGLASPLLRIDSFGPLDAYRGLVDLPAPTGVPLLDRARKSNRRPNFNNLAYVSISRRYLEDVLDLVRKRPRVYWRGLKGAVHQYFLSVTDDPRLRPLLVPLGAYPRQWDRWVYGRFEDTCLFVVAAIPLLLLHALAAIRGELRRPAPDHARVALLAYLAFNVAYVTVASNAVELGENNRFRFTLEPLLAVLLGFSVHWLAARLRGARRSPDATVAAAERSA
jgi:hypothetical protein